MLQEVTIDYLDPTLTLRKTKTKNNSVILRNIKTENSVIDENNKARVNQQPFISAVTEDLEIMRSKSPDIGVSTVKP